MKKLNVTARTFTVAVLGWSLGVYSMALPSAFAHADTAIDILDEQSGLFHAANDDYFGQLADKFAQGTLPAEADVQGLWSGRCYDPTERSKPEPSCLLAGVRVSTIGDPSHGPLFPPKVISSFGFLFISNPGEPADRFDQIDATVRADLLSLFDNSKFKEVKATTRNQSLVMDFEDQGFEYLLRASGPYLLGQARMTKDQAQAGYKAGDVVANCYYFKRLSRDLTK